MWKFSDRKMVSELCHVAKFLWDTTIRPPHWLTTRSTSRARSMEIAAVVSSSGEEQAGVGKRLGGNLDDR